MDIKALRILLFDIDGTLLDSAEEGWVCLRRALEDVYDTAGPIDTYQMAGKTEWQIVTELMTLAGLSAEAIEERRMDAFAAYAQHVSISAPAFEMRLLPGVKPLLERLAQHPEFLLGLVTGNVREAVSPKLRRVGIDPAQFRFGAFGNEHINRDTLPALALFRLEQILGNPIPPEDVLVIGDTPYDISCARHAGAKVLSVATGPYDLKRLAEHKPDYLLPDLADTDKVIQIFNEF